jgi:hypothetical protein
MRQVRGVVAAGDALWILAGGRRGSRSGALSGQDAPRAGRFPTRFRDSQAVDPARCDEVSDEGSSSGHATTWLLSPGCCQLMTGPKVVVQTEQLFVENAVKDTVQDSSVLEEWRAARGDHNIVAYAIANCLKIPNVVPMSCQDFAS